MKQLIWIKTVELEAWGCSACGWTFRPVGPPVGRDLEEMKENFERQRDQEFSAHSCAQYPKDLRAHAYTSTPRQTGVRAAAARTASRGQVDMTGAV